LRHRLPARRIAPDDSNPAGLCRHRQCRRRFHRQGGHGRADLFLAQRTALEAGDPVGVDPAHDELAFFPLIYWPIVPGAPKPPQDAINRIDAYMKQGGTVLFDTRDAIEAPPGEGGASQTPGMLALREHPFLARRSRARTGAARSRADQDVLSAARFSRPV
jgi:hypothetical protein